MARPTDGGVVGFIHLSITYVICTVCLIVVVSGNSNGGTVAVPKSFNDRRNSEESVRVFFSFGSSWRLLEFNSLMRLGLLFPSVSLLYLKHSFLEARRMSTRTYNDAIERLNSLQSNKVTLLDAVKASGGRLSQFAIPEMVPEYLEKE